MLKDEFNYYEWKDLTDSSVDGLQRGWNITILTKINNMLNKLNNIGVSDIVFYVDEVDEWEETINTFKFFNDSIVISIEKSDNNVIIFNNQLGDSCGLIVIDK